MRCAAAHGWTWAVAAGLIVVALGGCSGSAPKNAAQAGTKVLVALPLEVQASALDRAADASSDSADRSFRHFSTISEIASRYGASQAVIVSDEKVLASDGLKLTLDPTHGAFWGSVTAAQVKQHFGTTLVESSGTIAADTTARVPSGLTGVTGVVGLDASISLPNAVTGGSASPACPAQMPTRTSVADLFGFNKTVASGVTGAGTSVDILAIHRFEPAVFANFNRCTGSSLKASAITQSVVPDTPSTGGGPEVALDSLVLTLLAPGTHVHVAQFDPSTALAFPLIHLLERGSPPNVLDITVAYCETQLTHAELALSEWLLAAFAASGTTTAVAAGDKGSSGCYPSTSPAVTYPASSAFTTGIGGALYAGSASAPSGLAVWNDHESAGGGGGTSQVVQAPQWQGGGMRRVPDASAYSVPGGVGSIPVCATASDCVWSAVGGTSLGATVMGATGVLLEQEYGPHHVAQRWGDIAGAIWRRATRALGVTDIVKGANTTFTSVCCTAKAGYDTASGWGLIDPDALKTVFAK